MEKILSQDEITENCNRPADIFVEWQRGRLQGTWKKPWAQEKLCPDRNGRGGCATKRGGPACGMYSTVYGWQIPTLARRDNYGVRRIVGGMTRDDRGMGSRCVMKERLDEWMQGCGGATRYVALLKMMPQHTLSHSVRRVALEYHIPK